MRYSAWRQRRQTLLTWFSVVLVVFLQVQLLPTFSISKPQTSALDKDKAAVKAQYAKLPLAFEPNQGQTDDSVSYLVHHGHTTTFFSDTDTTTTTGDGRITMSLNGAANTAFTGMNQLDSKTNYFIGNDESQWHSDIPNYQQLLAKNVYPGIDLKYYGTNSTLEHDFIVSPNTDYKQIAFHFEGQQDLLLDKEGNIVLKLANEEFKLNAPKTYQQTLNSRHTIPSHFELNDNTITIALAADYDKSQPLIIDPTLTLTYSTYLGGSGDDFPWGVAVDVDGNAYVAGQTSSNTDFPIYNGFQWSFSGGGTDAFVAKLNADGSALVYLTYLGGANADAATSVVADSSGNAYVTGYTASLAFPQASPYQACTLGGYDAFVTKLNDIGSSLIYSTCIGGTNSDYSWDIALDSSANAYITGWTWSANFPTVTPTQASLAGSTDDFVTKLSAVGSTLLYSTYLGGSGTEGSANNEVSIAVDPSGNAYVTGDTNSGDFPMSSPMQGSNAGGSHDAFITKYNTTGTAYVYSTYLGGAADDIGRGIAADIYGNAYVVGYTDSTNFPTTSPYQASKAGGSDAFITKMNPSGSAHVYSTYFGGVGSEDPYGIAIDASNAVYITGITSGATGSTSFPTLIPFQAANAGTNDPFVTKMNPAGTALVYSTYLGGQALDQGQSIAVNQSTGAAIVAGYTASPDFPIDSPFQASNGGGYDTFITQLTDNTMTITGDPVNLEARVNPTLTFTIDSTSCALGALSVSQTQFCTYAMTAATNGTSGYAISYLPVTTLTSGSNTITALSTLTASTLNAEQFGINLQANTAVGSHTASAFGAAVSGGSGAVASAYNTANSFKLVAAGDTVAQSSVASLTSTFSISTIANITSTTEAGAYTTVLTYNIVAGY
jgi:hypothetical protein